METEPISRRSTGRGHVAERSELVFRREPLERFAKHLKPKFKFKVAIYAQQGQRPLRIDKFREENVQLFERPHERRFERLNAKRVRKKE